MEFKMKGIEHYGIDISERIRTARKYGRKKIETYLVYIKALEFHGDEAKRDLVQRCYDRLAQVFTTTVRAGREDEAKSWNTMDIAVELLTLPEYNEKDALAYIKKYENK